MLLAASLATGSLLGLIAYVLLLQLVRRLAAKADEPAPKQVRDKWRAVGEWLQEVPMPAFLHRFWTGADVSAMLMAAGVPWNPGAFTTLRWLALWLAIGLSVLLYLQSGISLFAVSAALTVLALAWLGPRLWLQHRAERRQQKVEHALPDLLDRLVLGMEAGLGFEVALRRAATDFKSLLGTEVRRMVRLLDLGHSKTDVLHELARRTPSEDLRGFAAAVRQAERLGTSLARTLRVQSDLMRARRRRRAHEASRRLPILIVFPLVFFFLPALLIIYLAPPVLHLFLNR